MNLPQGKKCYGNDVQKYLMTLNRVKYEKNHQRYTKDLFKDKRRLWEDKKSILHTQQKANACRNSWRNLMGECVQNFMLI